MKKKILLKSKNLLFGHGVSHHDTIDNLSPFFKMALQTILSGFIAQTADKDLPVLFWLTSLLKTTQY